MVSWVVALAVFLGSSVVSANSSPRPAIRRADEGLNPWVTIDVSGVASTVTPILTTINGAVTTLNAAPPLLTASNSRDGPAIPTEAPVGGYAFEVCTTPDGQYAPFCLPIQNAFNGTTLYTGKTYYITWESTAFPSTTNSSVSVLGTFLNTTDNTPTTAAFVSVGFVGFYPLAVDAAWTGSSILLSLSNKDAIKNGPVITVINEPAVYYQPPPTPVPAGQSLYIALPAVSGFVLICVVGGFIINRKHRKIGLGNIMGRKKDYSSGKSRRQRLGLGKRSEAIALRDQELTSEGIYRDVPIEQNAGILGENSSRVRHDSDDLEDLVDSPTEDRTNHFRDEMRRQDTGRH